MESSVKEHILLPSSSGQFNTLPYTHTLSKHQMNWWSQHNDDRDARSSEFIGGTPSSHTLCVSSVQVMVKVVDAERGMAASQNGVGMATTGK